MAKDGGQGSEVMSAAELKPLLLLAKRTPVSCAVGLTRDKQGVVLLHKRTRPRKLTAELLRHGKGAGLDLDRASLRFGRASVDGGSDSTAVNFTINKEPPGALHLKLIEKLRPAGFQRCTFTVDAKLEDESDEDEPDREDEGNTPAAPHPGQDTSSAAHPPAAVFDAPPTASSPAQAPAPAAPTSVDPAPATAGSNGQATAAQPDAAALKAALRGLAEQIRPMMVADPSRGATLVKTAMATRDSLSSGDLPAAQAGIEALRQQIQTAAGNGSAPSPALLTPALFSNVPGEPAVTAVPSAPAPALAPTPPAPGLTAPETDAVADEGLEAAVGPLLLWFGLGGLSFVAAMVIPTNAQRSNRSAAVDGRADMAGTVTTAPGSRSSQVTIRLHGQPDRTLGTFTMDPDGSLTDGGHAPTLGTVAAGSIHLTPEGKAELLRRAGQGAAPGAGSHQPDGVPPYSSPTDKAPHR